MRDIAIYGAGGFGKEVAVLIEENNKKSPQWNFIGFFDDGIEKGNQISNLGKVLGGINEINNWEKPLALSLCFGNPKTLKGVREKIKNPLISFPNLINHSCWFGNKELINIGQGNIIQGLCYFSTDIKIGDFNVLNGFITIGHDVIIGNYNVIMPRAIISGGSNIGNCNLIGSASFIKQQLRIGNNVTISPLSSLLTKPKDGKTYIGNPAKIFKF